MGQALKRFIPRAPRYVLRAQDRSDMRFSLEHTLGNGGIEHTILLNLSETGCAFLVNVGAEPHIHERIKVEIPIPGGEQIAWWANVVRVSAYEPFHWGWNRNRSHDADKILVALRFDELPEPHTRNIRAGIKKSMMQAMRDQQHRNWVYYKTGFIENAAKFLLFAALAAATIGIIYWLTLPDANYDPKRGAPWGERFKF